MASQENGIYYENCLLYWGRLNLSEVIRKSIIFVDIRGFSKVAMDPHLVPITGEFVADFQKSIADAFPDSFIKYLGDGAMIIPRLEDISIMMQSIMSLVFALLAIDCLWKRDLLIGKLTPQSGLLLEEK